MRKAILIIDMPNSCRECPLFGSRYSDMCCGGMNNRTIDYPYPKDFRQDWCPLKPVPEPKLEWYDDERSDWERGYNDCLHEIVDEEDVEENDEGWE